MTFSLSDIKMFSIDAYTGGDALTGKTSTADRSAYHRRYYLKNKHRKKYTYVKKKNRS